MAQVSYPDSTETTPSVSYTYDATFGRLASITDGIGTTTYSYYPYNSGVTSGQIQSVDGPLAGDVDLATYTYDALGRLETQQLGGITYFTTKDVTDPYDSLQRLTHYQNALGAYQTSFVPESNRVASVQTSSLTDTATSPVFTSGFSYYPVGTTAGNSNLRVQTVAHKSPANQVLERYTYDYSVSGRIDQITSQHGSQSSTQRYGYDAIDQLTSAVKDQGSSSQRHYAYRYDAAGNRTSKQVDSALSMSAHNVINSLKATSDDDGGKTRFYGCLLYTSPSPRDA